MEPIFNSGDDSCYIVFACVCTIGLGGICGAAIQFGSLWIPKGGVKGYFICWALLTDLDGIPLTCVEPTTAYFGISNLG